MTLRRTIRGIAGAALVLLLATDAEAAPKIPYTNIVPLKEPIEIEVRSGFFTKCNGTSDGVPVRSVVELVLEDGTWTLKSKMVVGTISMTLRSPRSGDGSFGTLHVSVVRHSIPSNVVRTFDAYKAAYEKRRSVEALYNRQTLHQGTSLFPGTFRELAEGYVLSLTPDANIERINGDVNVLGSVTKPDGEAYIAAAGDLGIEHVNQSYPYRFRSALFLLIHQRSRLIAEYSERSVVQAEGLNTKSESSLSCAVMKRESTGTNQASSDKPEKSSQTEPSLRGRTVARVPDRPARTVIALVWAGVDDILLGDVSYESAGQATINVTSAPTGRCRGFLVHDTSSAGTWTLACTGGLTAQGTIKGSATNEISGRGSDSRGNTVRFRLREASGANTAGG